MPRYFFDHHEGEVIRDDIGVVLPNEEAAFDAAMGSLPAIARDRMQPGSGHCHNISIVVRSEDGVPIYSAALSFCGTRF